MSRSALVDPRAVTAVAVRPSTALVVTDAKRQLATVATIKGDAERQFSVITRNRGDHARESVFHGVARALHRVYIPSTDGPPLPSLLGLVGGVAAGFACSSLWLGVSVFAAGIALCPLHLPLAGWFERTGKRLTSRARSNLIPLADLRPMLERYEAASGAERTALRNILAGWLQEMDAKRALSPEARQALQHSTKITEPTDVAERDRLESMKAIVLEVQEQGELDLENVKRLKGLVARTPEPDRQGLTLAVCAMVRESGRLLSYEAVHALHQMEQDASAASER